MQPKLLPKWCTIHTEKVQEHAKTKQRASKKILPFGEFVNWLHDET